MNADLFEPLDHSALGIGPTEPQAFTLELETDDSRRHREDREAAARERKRQREELDERRRRPLVGSRGDFEQTRLFGREELFQ